MGKKIDTLNGEISIKIEELKRITNHFERSWQTFFSIQEVADLFSDYSPTQDSIITGFCDQLRKSETLTLHADQLQRMGRHVEALKSYDQAIKISKAPGGALYASKAESFSALKLPEEADKCYTIALRQADLDSARRDEIEQKRKSETALIGIRSKLNLSSLNPSVYCCMSELAYHKDIETVQDASLEAAYNFLKEHGWEIVTTSEDCGYTKDGYFARVFRNCDTNQLVVAHRGTIFESGPLKADHELLSGNVPDQYSNAAHRFVSSLSHQYPDYEITHTGHSLGGALAALCAYNFCQSATIFDPYGIREVLIKVNPDFMSDRYRALPITTFLSGLNVVNVASEHVGLQLHFRPKYVPKSMYVGDIIVDLLARKAEKLVQDRYLGDNPFIISELHSDLSHHKIAHIRAAFINPNSLPTQLRLVRSWISNNENYFKLIGEKALDRNGRTFIDLESISDLALQNRITRYGYNTCPFDLHRIQLSYFDPGTREVIKEVCQGKELNGLHDDVRIILTHCKVDGEELTIPDHSMTVLDLKLYLERTKHLQQFRECSKSLEIPRNSSERGKEATLEHRRVQNPLAAESMVRPSLGVKITKIQETPQEPAASSKSISSWKRPEVISTALTSGLLLYYFLGRRQGNNSTSEVGIDVIRLGKSALAAGGVLAAAKYKGSKPSSLHTDKDQESQKRHRNVP